MDYEQFISSVEDAVGPVDAPTTLRTLADRLSGVHVRSAVVRLAPEPAPSSVPAGPMVRIDLDDYLPPVAAWKGSPADTVRQAEAVFATLLDVLGPELFERQAFERRATRPLPARGRPQSPVVAAVPLSVFFSRVTPPAHVVADTARRFADAVLETLAERMAPAEVAALVERLPAEMQCVLKYASHVYPGTGKHTRLQRLLDHVAERDDTCEELDAQPPRAPLAVRPEVGAEAELLHLARQLVVRLPPGYALSWERR